MNVPKLDTSIRSRHPNRHPTESDPVCFALLGHTLWPVISARGLLLLLRLGLEQLFNFVQEWRLDLIQGVHHLLYGWPIDWVNLKPRLLCFSQKLGVFQSIHKCLLQGSRALFGNLWRKRKEPLVTVNIARYLQELFSFFVFCEVDCERHTF